MNQDNLKVKGRGNLKNNFPSSLVIESDLNYNLWFKFLGRYVRYVFANF